MSTEKSCKGCIHINCRCSDRQQKNYECYNNGLLPAQQHAEGLLEALKKDHKSYHKMYRENDIGKCPTCQLIARAEGREL